MPNALPHIAGQRQLPFRRRISSNLNRNNEMREFLYQQVKNKRTYNAEQNSELNGDLMKYDPVPLLNFSITQFCNAGCSSLRNIPLYFTEGGPCEHPGVVTKRLECVVIGTSAHLKSRSVSWQDTTKRRRETLTNTMVKLQIVPNDRTEHKPYLSCQSQQ